MSPQPHLWVCIRAWFTPPPVNNATPKNSAGSFFFLLSFITEFMPGQCWEATRAPRWRPGLAGVEILPPALPWLFDSGGPGLRIRAQHGPARLPHAPRHKGLGVISI